MSESPTDPLKIFTPEEIANFQSMGSRPFYSGFKDDNLFYRIVMGTEEFFQWNEEESLHWFFLFYLKHKLNELWFDRESRLPAESRHPLVTWMMNISGLEELIKGSDKLPLNVNEYLDIGDVLSLLTFAFDFFTLFHNGVIIPKKILRRLRNDKPSFEGYKYEINVAAVLVRAGFDVEWIDNDVNRVDFLATHKVTGEKIIVEAKSKNRNIAQDSAIKSEEEMKLGVKLAIEDAESKVEDRAIKIHKLPYYVFINLGWPINPDLEKTFNFISAGINQEILSTNSSIYTGIFLTNFSWHQRAHNKGFVRTLSFYVPSKSPTYNLLDKRPLSEIAKVLKFADTVPIENVFVEKDLTKIYG